MVLKRKFSDSETSTSSSFLSTPPSASSYMSIDQSYQSHIATPSLFASRTRKRYRDNRPSETHLITSFLRAAEAATGLPTYLFPTFAITSAGACVFTAVEFAAEPAKQSTLFLAWADGVSDATVFTIERSLCLGWVYAVGIAAYDLDVPGYQLRRLRCVARPGEQQDMAYDEVILTRPSTAEWQHGYLSQNHEKLTADHSLPSATTGRGPMPGATQSSPTYSLPAASISPAADRQARGRAGPAPIVAPWLGTSPRGDALASTGYLPSVPLQEMLACGEVMRRRAVRTFRTTEPGRREFEFENEMAW
ncbi:hypothetical protein JHW43_004964 [Diplocarpon mali]|nr:hypothetical protein JHW43_004964 [Diplocarpon mali]